MTPTNDHKSSGLSEALIGLGLVGLVVTASVVSLIHLEGRLAPRVGDIIAFDRTTAILRDSEARITAVRVGDASGAPCILEARVMWASGGSLLIDAVRREPRLGYRVHWAGARTTDDAADCGTSAELLLGPTDIAALTFAAGGSGITVR